MRLMLFILFFLTLSGAALACNPDTQAIQNDLTARGLIAAGRQEGDLEARKFTNLQPVYVGESGGTACPKFYVGEMEFTFKDGCVMKVSATNEEGNIPQITKSCGDTGSVYDSAKVKTICARVDAQKKITDMQCMGFTGAEFFCGGGLVKVDVPEADFPQKCGPYR